MCRSLVLALAQTGLVIAAKVALEIFGSDEDRLALWTEPQPQGEEEINKGPLSLVVKVRLNTLSGVT